VQISNFRTIVSKFSPMWGATKESPSSLSGAMKRRWTQSSDGAESAFKMFLSAYPAYESTRVLDVLRATDYARLDRQGHVYLDYTGGSLYPESLVREHVDLLVNNIYGNPHSKNSTSLAMTQQVEATRELVLQYFNADPAEYVAIFTPNASGALRLVGEAYPFTPASTYLLTFDNHNSVNGIREFARARGANVTYLPCLRHLEMRIDPDQLRQVLGQATHTAPNLFAYPAQSNFTGVQHSLNWIAEAQTQGWDVLLDAAAFAPTNRLDLRQYHPDFVDLSFYKMIGYPTGIGCLLARKSALQKLQRPWFAGGTITFSSVLGDGHYLTPGAAGFEDGTVNYLGIPAIGNGLRLIASLGIDTIHTRVACLTDWLISQLLTLRHSNGRPVLQLYGLAHIQGRGGTLSVNFFDRDGHMMDCTDVEQRANAANISLRAGCHCNPGARELALGLDQEDLVNCFSDQTRVTFEQFLRGIAGQTTGALRASLGLVSNFADVYTYVQFAKTFVT